MNGIDIVVLIIVLGGLIRGFLSGGIRQVFGLVGMVVSILLAIRLAGALQGNFESWFGVSETVAPVLAFGAIFLCFHIVLYVMIRILENLLEKARIDIVNKMVGSAVGGFKAVLIVSMMLFVARYVGIPDAETREDSLLYEYVYPVLPGVWTLIADNLPELPEQASTMMTR